MKQKLGSKKKLNNFCLFFTLKKNENTGAGKVKEPKKISSYLLNKHIRSCFPFFHFEAKKIEQNWCTLVLKALQVIAYNLSLVYFQTLC